MYMNKYRSVVPNDPRLVVVASFRSLIIRGSWSPGTFKESKDHSDLRSQTIKGTLFLPGGPDSAQAYGDPEVSNNLSPTESQDS
jgi:hypothetical protein